MDIEDKNLSSSFNEQHSIMSKVETVTGPVSTSSLGTTLMHEHILFDLRKYYSPNKLSGPITLEKLGELRKNPLKLKENLLCLDENLQTRELRRFRQAGGNTIVDLSSIGLRQKLPAVARIAKKARVNVLCGTGFYVKRFHPRYLKRKKIEELKELIVQEIEEGIDGSRIKASIIGECGCSSPIPYHPDEKKALIAAARAQRSTQAPITIHPSESAWNMNLESVMAVETYADLIEREGADLSKFYISHIDRSCRNLAYHRRLLDRGITLCYDNFGKEIYFEGILRGITDWDRIDALVELCREGYDKQLVVSHDICLRTDLSQYGGFGYSHVLKNIIPALRANGVSRKQVANILANNPSRLLRRA